MGIHLKRLHSIHPQRAAGVQDQHMRQRLGHSLVGALDHSSTGLIAIMAGRAGGWGFSAGLAFGAGSADSCGFEAAACSWWGLAALLSSCASCPA